MNAVAIEIEEVREDKGPSLLGVFLPASAIAKYRRFEDAAEEAYAAYRISSEKVMKELQPEAQRLEEHHRLLIDKNTIRRSGLGHAPLSEDNPQAVDAKRRADAAKAELDHARTVMNLRSQRAAEATRAASTCSAYLERLTHGTALTAAHGPEFKLGRAETHTSAVEKLREQITTVRRSIEEARTAPMHSSLALENIRRKIDGLAEAGRVDVFDLLEVGGGNIKFPEMLVQVNVRGIANVDGRNCNVAGAGNARIPYTPAILAWLFKGELLERFEAEILRVAEDDRALTPAERVEREATLKSKLLELERLEEAAISAAESAGISIARRAEVDARALLGVEGPEVRERS